MSRRRFRYKTLVCREEEAGKRANAMAQSGWRVHTWHVYAVDVGAGETEYWVSALLEFPMSLWGVSSLPAEERLPELPASSREAPPPFRIEIPGG